MRRRHVLKRVGRDRADGDIVDEDVLDMVTLISLDLKRLRRTGSD